MKASAKRKNGLIRTLPSRERLQHSVNQFFDRLNCRPPFVMVEISTENSVLAKALGVTFQTLSFGKIKIAQKLLDILTEAEVDFLLAHEVSHIHLNHLLGTGSFVVVRELVENAARNDPQWKYLLTIWDIYKILTHWGGDLPPFAAVTKEQELDADAWAVFLTGNKAAARSALRKLVGNNLDTPSHTWEVFDTAIPVMTIRERLSALDASVVSRK